jgi:hypothetical protein
VVLWDGFHDQPLPGDSTTLHQQPKSANSTNQINEEQTLKNIDYSYKF